MKPTTLHTLLFTILFSAVSIFSANAQLTYSGGRLSLDTTPIGSYKVSIAGNGAYFKLPSQTNFFQIDISSENTRLAGHGDQISFYNSSTNKYNSINVLNVYYHSDARAKTNVRDFSQGLEVISRIRPVTMNPVLASGRATCVNIRYTEHPSMQAASNNSLGIPAKNPTSM